MANPLIIPFKDKHPNIGKNVFIAPNATVIGEVDLGDQVSIWFGAVLRGDIMAIRIGARTNIQDLSMVHTSTGLVPVIIGEDCTIGHNSIIHGAQIGNNCLIGMGSTLLDNVVVEDNVIVGANSLVLQGARLESGWLYAGSPVRKIKQLQPHHFDAIKEGAEHYIKGAEVYRNQES